MKSKSLLLRSFSIFLILMGSLTLSFSQKTKSDKKSKNPTFFNLTYTDIGTATKTGISKFTNDKLEMIAGGADIWGTHDEFRFGYKTITGDFDLSVQVLSLKKSNQYTKAGIMARVNLSDSSQHVYFQVFPDNTPRNKNNGGCEFQYRNAPGAEMKAIYPDPASAGNQFDVAFPDTWIRLKRKGDVFESYFSKDNKNWTLYSSYTLKLPEALLVGLAVTSHNSGNSTTAGFASIHLDK